MADARTFVIVGAGQAARWIALTLRDGGFDGRLLMLGDEAHPPYERPPLSKAALKDDGLAAPPLLLTADQRDTLAIDWRGGQRVVAIDRAARTVQLERGEVIGYDMLFLAHGGRARTLPGVAAHPRIVTLRTWDDAQTLRRQLADARHVLVIGGGWIGLEVAASARLRGCAVTVIEAAPRLCQRTVPACISALLHALHTDRGVALRVGQAVQQVAADDAGVSVQLAGGERLRGDLLVLGIGLVANDQLAAAAGLATGNGVHVDDHGRTADPAVFAAGDVALAVAADGTRTRIESWENAQRQAVAAAKAALGIAHDPAADGPPWFWSDQYDDNLQLLGLPEDNHRLIERRLPAPRQHLVFFCASARVRALAALNRGRDVSIVRRWIAKDRFPDLDALADATVDLKPLPLLSPAAHPETP